MITQGGIYCQPCRSDEIVSAKSPLKICSRDYRFIFSDQRGVSPVGWIIGTSVLALTFFLLYVSSGKGGVLPGILTLIISFP